MALSIWGVVLLAAITMGALGASVPVGGSQSELASGTLSQSSVHETVYYDFGDTDFTRSHTLGAGVLNLQVTETGGSSGLDGFKLLVKMHRDGAWVDLLSGTDWDTATSTLLYVSTTGPHEIAASGTATAIIRLRGVAWKFQATAAGADADVTIKWSVTAS